MGYSIKLVGEDGEPVKVESHYEGSNMLIGGNTDAEITITYNYGFFFYKHIDTEEGIRWMYGRKASDCVATLNAAILALGTDLSGDYWEPTPGNSGHALAILRGWAIQHPTARFMGD